MSVASTEPDAPVAPDEPNEPDVATSSRDSLALTYRHYVLKVARQVAEAMPMHLELDDLVGWGHMGLLEAAARFDASRGTSFRTFAHPRIRGAIYDGIRRELGPRMLLALPPDDALASRLVVVADAGYELDGEPSAGHGRGSRPLAARESVWAQDRDVWLREVREMLERASDTLTPLERSVLYEHYVLGRPVQSLVERSRHSKSWLSRVHARALAKMRARLLARTAGKGIFL